MGWPWFLPEPNGNRFLYTVRLDVGKGEVRLAQLAALDDPDGTLRPVQFDPTTLINASSNAQWVAPDVVVFVREGLLLGQRVNLEEARSVADPFPAVHLAWGQAACLAPPVGRQPGRPAARGSAPARSR